MKDMKDIWCKGKKRDKSKNNSYYDMKVDTIINCQ